MSELSLVLTYSLIIIAMILSYKGKVGLEKDLLIGSVRAVIQLSLIGVVLKYVFEIDNYFLTTVILIGMVYNATMVAAKRGGGLKKAKIISFVAILSGLVVILGILLLVQAISYQPAQAIPVSGMVVGNSMVAMSLLLKNLQSSIKNSKDEIETKLCLGASPYQAVKPIISDSIKTAMLPTVDSMKTLGIVQLPGMMTGLILAGIEPTNAIKYQVMVAFMLSGAVTITAFIASFWAYRVFFTDKAQLKNI